MVDPRHPIVPISGEEQRALAVVPERFFVHNDAFELRVMKVQDAQPASDLLRATLGAFTEVESVIASSLRRIENLYNVYTRSHSLLIVTEHLASKEIVAAVGIGPLADLPIEEGYGEIRELAVARQYRGRGLGRIILEAAVRKVVELNYKKVYIQTTSDMKTASVLFEKLGFMPVYHSRKDAKNRADRGTPVGLAHYYFKEF